MSNVAFRIRSDAPKVSEMCAFVSNIFCHKLMIYAPFNVIFFPLPKPLPSELHHAL